MFQPTLILGLYKIIWLAVVTNFGKFCFFVCFYFFERFYVYALLLSQHTKLQYLCQNVPFGLCKNFCGEYKELRKFLDIQWNLDITKSQLNMFSIRRFRFIEVLFHVFHCYCGNENCSLYRGLRCTEAPLHYETLTLYQNMQFLTTLHSTKVNLLSGHVPN